jgi:CxxC motif-containing protein (DUF1111 family)
VLGSVAVAAVVAAAVAAARPSFPPAAEGTEVRELGGAGSAVLLRGRPFHQDDRRLTTDGQRAFAAGAVVFGEPVRVTATDGARQPFSPRPGAERLPDATGPLLVEAACITCHVDGTEAEPVAAPGPGLVVRVADAAGAGEGRPHPTLGVQVSTVAVPGSGATPEGRVELRWETLRGTAPAGWPEELRRPLGEVTGALVEAGGRPAVSLRVAPPLLGLGLLESVPAPALDALADPDDADGDGVSGRRGRGRFGWKASQLTVRSQTVVALSLDMGVTTGESPDPCEDRPVGCDRVAERQDRPELVGQPFDDLVLYTEAIAVPRARSLSSPEVRRGAQVFTAVGCSSCHTPTLRTAPASELPPERRLYADRVIHPYTDLLLHDMGPGLDDGVGEPGAGSSEWRTAPLWGLGWRERVYGAGSFLHDGRAASVQEAILWHGGEAAPSRNAVLRLAPEDRTALVRFLRSL